MSEAVSGQSGSAGRPTARRPGRSAPACCLLCSRLPPPGAPPARSADRVCGGGRQRRRRTGAVDRRAGCRQSTTRAARCDAAHRPCRGRPRIPLSRPWRRPRRGASSCRYPVPPGSAPGRRFRCGPQTQSAPPALRAPPPGRADRCGSPIRLIPPLMPPPARTGRMRPGSAHAGGRLRRLPVPEVVFPEGPGRRVGQYIPVRS